MEEIKRTVIIMTLPEKYIVNETGAKVAVILPIEEYDAIVEQLEELEDLRAFDAAKASNEEAIPFDQAVQEIERSRRQ